VSVRVIVGIGISLVALAAPAAITGQQIDPQGAPALAPAGTGAAPAQVAGVEEYRIGPEDVLDISVWKNTELTRTVIVRPDGRISLPLLNEVEAAGRTPGELRDQLAKGYSEFVNEAEVSVIVREIHSNKVSVLGMVRLPGRYELRSQTTILEALAQAGGFTEFAKRNQIMVFRNDGRRSTRLPFDYNSVLDYGPQQNFVLRPGDIVIVP
jgi:polysaccharide export outer membrane protein